MKTNVPRIGLTLTALSLIPAMALANGFRNPPEGAAQLGRSAARSTLADDASVVVHNPANMIDLPDQQALAAVTIINAKTEYSGPMGRSGETEDPWKMIPSLFYTTPLKDGAMAAGVGLSSPYGQSTEWKKDGPFAGLAPYFAEMKMVDISPAFAAKITEQVQVGVALDLIWSELSFDQIYPWSAVTGDPRSPAGVAAFEGDALGVGVHLGVTWQMTEAQRVAFTYKSPFSIDYEGDFKVSNVPPGAPIRPSSGFETEITFPTVLALGYGIDVNERLSLGAEVEWIEFSQYDQLDINIGPNNVLLPATTVPQNWDDTWTFGVGGDYDLNEDWVLRAGYIFLESPVPDETLSPTLPDADRHLLSIGIGWTGGPHRVDFAYAYSIYDDRDISTNLNPAYNGSYDLTAHLLALSYAFDF